MRNRSCCYCKRQLTKPTDRANTAATSDHVLPVSLGGRRKVPCCRKCNNLKADIHPSLWRIFTENYPKWWKNFHSSREVRAAINYTLDAQRRKDTVDDQQNATGCT